MKRGIQIAKKVIIILGTILSIVMMVLATIICFSIQWMFDTWSNLTMDELMFHLTAPLEGTNDDKRVSERVCCPGGIDFNINGDIVPCVA